MFFCPSHSAIRGPTPLTNLTSVLRSSTQMMINGSCAQWFSYPRADLRLATRLFGLEEPCSALKNCGRLKWSILKVNLLVHDGHDVSCTPSFTWLGSTSNERKHLGQVTMICPEPFSAIQMGEVLRLPGTGRSGALRTRSLTVRSRSGME